MASLWSQLFGKSRRTASDLPLRSAQGRLTLHAIVPADLITVRTWLSNPETCRLAFGVDTDWETMKELAYDYLQELSSDLHGVLAVHAYPSSPTEPLIGLLRYKIFRQGFRSKARVGILLGDTHHRHHGLGTEAMKTFLEFLFNKGLASLVELDTALFNKAAQSCFKKCGFQIIREVQILGLHNRWTEQRVVMSLSASDWTHRQTAQLPSTSQP